MEVLLENTVSYFIIILMAVSILFYYLRNKEKKTISTYEKIEKAKAFGLHEPVSLHPVIDTETCIGSGACIAACPERDIIGLVEGHAKVINASRCVGHGACFHACPVQAISLFIGTEKRGVELPHVSPDFETNIPGLFIAGELGGMGLIKNAVEQGKQAVENISKKIKHTSSADYDLIIVGAGPAGISASLAAKKNNLNYLTIEQDNLGGTVFNFPRAKIIMTSPMDLPLFGKVKLSETSKSELLNMWDDILNKNKIVIREQEKVEAIEKTNNYFEVKTNKGFYTSNFVILSIGRRGSPRKLGIPGEQKEKVFYRLLEPELIKNTKVLIAGGGDSAIESALLLTGENNEVTVSYRGNSFSRLKPKNLEKINKAVSQGQVKIILNSNIKEIKDTSVLLSINGMEELREIENDLVYIFAGGILPTEFLEKIGIKITKKFGEAVLSHKN
jgi:thioredoxin reductase/Pyruvate/2-oxoacid:ferredoxin oxidoreductase delta subunit